jgi:peptidoglycan/LPS O-acetylase OafA/YrhL
MDKKLSSYLDIVRVIASFAVLFQHLSMYNNDVFAFFSNYGHPAVMGFFILSGYVIAFVAEQREKTFDTYLKHRLARLYSVMVVAWLLTIALDTIGPSINSSIYEGMVSNDNFFVRAFAHLFFLQESWFVSIQFFSNQPLWSLAYEFWYYILFGLIFLYKGKFKLGLITLSCLIMGPVILIYGTIWFAGAALYKIHQREDNLNPTLASFLFLLSIPVIFSYPYWNHYLLPESLGELGKLSFRTLVDDIIFASFIIINLFSFKYTNFSFSLIKPTIRFFSGIAFSLYVFHFPLIFFYKALLTRYLELSDSALFFILTILIILTVYLLSYISERKKKSYYKLFEKLENIIFTPKKQLTK